MSFFNVSLRHWLLFGTSRNTDLVCGFISLVVKDIQIYRLGMWFDITGCKGHPDIQTWYVVLYHWL